MVRAMLTKHVYKALIRASKRIAIDINIPVIVVIIIVKYDINSNKKV